jgi:hypothetical protein
LRYGKLDASVDILREETAEADVPDVKLEKERGQKKIE